MFRERPLPDVGADVVGFSLHKWLHAPIGTGGIWIRGSRLADIEPYMGSTMFPEDDTRSRTNVGTVTRIPAGGRFLPPGGLNPSSGAQAARLPRAGTTS